MDIIASIHDKWFQLIKSGEKTIEVRKTLPKRLVEKENHYIYWYNTKTKKIEGKSRLACIESLNEDSLYESDYEYSCLSIEEIQEYVGGTSHIPNIYFWYLGDFEPLDIKLPESKRPPQSWCYYDTIFHPLIAINPNFNNKTDEELDKQEEEK